MRPLLPRIRLTLAIGVHAHAWHLGARRKSSVADTVRAWEEYSPALFPLPHPSPRNRKWLRDRPWFEQEVLPELRRRFEAALQGR